MDEKTKKEIWETFKDKFIEEGINSPDELVFQDKIPPEKELVKNGSILKRIGSFEKFVIWVMKKAVWVGGAIVVYAALPGALEEIRTRHPRTFEVVNNVGQAIKSYYTTEPTYQLPEDKNENQYVGQYVVFNDGWQNNRTKFEEEVKALNEMGKISDDSILAPATGIDPIIMTQSDISVASSDLT